MDEPLLRIDYNAHSSRRSGVRKLNSSFLEYPALQLRVPGTATLTTRHCNWKLLPDTAALNTFFNYLYNYLQLQCTYFAVPPEYFVCLALRL
jgi:hypothetical protein